MFLRAMVVLGVLGVVLPPLAFSQQQGTSCEARVAIAQQYAQSLLGNVMEREAALADMRLNLLRALGKPDTDQAQLSALFEEVKHLKSPPPKEESKKK